MPIEVRERVWASWVENSEHTGIVLRSGLPLDEALVALARARQQALWVMADRTGWISPVSPSPEGPVVGVNDYEDFDLVLASLVRSLEDAGVEGTLDESVVDGPDVFSPFSSRSFDLVECRLSLPGRPVSSWGGWQTEPEALRSAVDQAVDWCVEPGVGSCYVGYGEGHYAVDPGTRAQLVRPELLTPESTFEAVWEHGEHLRLFRLRRGGHACFVEGRDASADFAWLPAVNELRDVLQRAAAQAVYGFVKRGSSLQSARFATSLREDWPPLPHAEVRRVESAVPHLEQRYVPDAFGIQLLGAAHAERLGVGDAWTTVPIGNMVVVEHRDLEAWYAGSVPDPQVLHAAREEFEALLMRDDLLVPPRPSPGDSADA